jgi:hypothetical protein
VSSAAKLHRVTLIALALAPAALAGQRLEFVGGGGGVVSPAGSFGGVDHAGWQLSALAVARLKGRLALTLDALSGRTGHKSGVAGSSALSGATVNLALVVRREDARVRPFLSAGAGLYSVDVAVSGFGSAGATKLALGAGAGVVVGAGGRREYFIARYVSVRTTPQHTNFLAIGVGVLVPLGRH